MAKPRKHTKLFKLKVVQEYIGGASVASLARKHKIHENLIYKWRQQFESDPVGAFRGDSDTNANSDAERIAALEAENALFAQLLGKSMLEQDFLKKSLRSAENFLTTLPHLAAQQRSDGESS